MEYKNYYCLFEQSGHFKNELKKMGFNSYDYDLKNDFGETDFIIDLFNEIEKGYNDKKSIFDNFTANDFVFAFFPCTYFSGQNNLFWGRKYNAFRLWSDKKIDRYIQDRLDSRDYFYSLICKLTDISKRKGFAMVIENPYSGNALVNIYKNFYKPNLVIMDRLEYGDNFKKPTMFFSFNFSFKFNYIKKEENEETQKLINDCNQVERSMITPIFIRNFLRTFILPGNGFINSKEV